MEFESRPQMEIFSYQLGDEVKVMRLERAGDVVQVVIADRTYDVQINHVRSDEITFTLAGRRHTAHMASDGTTRYIAIDGDGHELRKPDPRRARRQQHHGEDNLSASMPGQITRVLVDEGDAVQRGQPLIVLEAMKMEIKITAPHDGRVAKLLVKPGQIVDRGQRLIEMKNEQSTPPRCKDFVNNAGPPIIDK